jgi:hypothetical protein
MRSISATVFGVITTPRQPRLDSSSTAQISDSALVSAGEPADHLGAPADLDERALQKVRGPDPFAVLGGPAQMRHQRVEVALDDRHRRGVAGAVVGMIASSSRRASSAGELA